MKRFWITTLCLAILMLSCKQTKTSKEFYNEQGLLVKQWFYPDGKTVELERTFKNDTISHGYGKKFYPTGELMIYAEYADGKKHGKQIEYYLNGVAKKSGTFVKGLVSGNSFEYYPNGKIKLCYFHNPTGGWASKIEYDSTGIEKSREGDSSPLVVFVTTHDVDKWKVGEEFKIRVLVNQCESSNEVELQFKEVRTGKVVSSEKFESENGVVNYSRVLCKPGEYFFTIIQDEGRGLVNKNKIKVEM